MTYKQIPFTLEEWQKDPEGRKIVHNEDGSIAAFAGNFPGSQRIAIIWEDGESSSYSMPQAGVLFTLLIPVKTVRKWRNLYADDLIGGWYEDTGAIAVLACTGRFAILSAEFDESGNYVKGTVKVEEV